MKQKLPVLICTLSLILLFFPTAHAEGQDDELTVLVGLAYDSHAIPGANLANSEGTGYRFGYLDSERTFCPLGETRETSISVVKTQNVWYGLDSNYSSTLRCYSDAITSDIAVGCWHVQLPADRELTTFEETSALAEAAGGFPAWIEGKWQVRFGAYLTREEAQGAAEQLGGNVVGTSAYGVSVVKTGNTNVLFQFDGGAEHALTVAPGLDDAIKAVTHYRGSRYYGMFQFRRINGGNLTVINALSLDDYTNCVITQEMSASWPLEALKAQAVCARTYWAFNKNKHGNNGFDLCYTTHCQAYPGMGAVTAKTTQAIQETSNQRIWYNGSPIDAVYFSSDGGATEDAKNVWGGSAPYLKGVIDPYEATISDKIAGWKWSRTFTAAEITEKLRGDGYGCSDIVDVKLEYTPTGNVKSLNFVDSNGKVFAFVRESGVRNYMGFRSIRYSVTASGGGSNGTYYTDGGGQLTSMKDVYTIDGKGRTGRITDDNIYVITSEGVQPLPTPYGATTDPNTLTFTFNGSGWGHSLGMSQWGAYAMALQGFTYDQILQFYYTGIEIY